MNFTNNMKPYYMLFVRVNIKAPIMGDVQRAIDWMGRKTPLNISSDFMDVQMPVRIESTGRKPSEDAIREYPYVAGKEYYALTNIFEILDSKKIYAHAYDLVHVLYDPGEWDRNNKILPAWTGGYYKGSCLIQTPAGAVEESSDWLYMAVCHETMHAFWWEVQQKMQVWFDTMDVYDVNNPDVDAGNFQRNLKALGAFWDTIAEEPLTWPILRKLIQLLQELLVLKQKQTFGGVGGPTPCLVPYKFPQA